MTARISASDGRRLGIAGPKRHKYGAVRTELDGHKFASKAEAKRYAQLRLLEQAGEIRSLTLQPRFPMHVAKHLICTYVGDFQYIECSDGRVVVEDTKSEATETPVFRIKRNLFLALYPKHELRVTR